MNSDIPWRIDTNTHLVAFHAQYRHGYVVANDQRLVDSAGQYQ